MAFRLHPPSLLASFAVPLGAGALAFGTAAPPAAPPSAPARSPAPAPPAALPGGALDRDCAHVGDVLGPGYRFIGACPGRAASPDRRWAVANRPGDGGIVLVDSAGRPLDEIATFNDAMPFVLFWSPDSTWLFANHYQGSGLERLRVFEIVNRTAVERSAVYANAIRTAVERYPCLGRDAQVYASGWRWSRDGRRIVLTVYARPDACLVQTRRGVWEPAGEWEVLWMIGEAEGGRIDPASVRVRPDGVGPMPTDGPYAAL